jgi:hypothetical protein
LETAPQAGKTPLRLTAGERRAPPFRTARAVVGLRRVFREWKGLLRIVSNANERGGQMSRDYGARRQGFAPLQGWRHRRPISPASPAATPANAAGGNLVQRGGVQLEHKRTTEIAMMNAVTNGKGMTALLLAAGLAMTVGAGAAAQQGRSASDDWCRDDTRSRSNWGGDREAVCEVREYTVPATGATVIVNAAPNGGIDVEGSARRDILVRAKIVATAGTTEEARAILGRVQIYATADRVRADGPGGLGRREGYSVSYRLSVPRATPLSLESTNGGISVDNVNSHFDVRTVNGGVTLTHVGGDVTGRTTNGGVNVSLDGATWDGGGLDVQTTNGGVNLAIPAEYSAHLETGTHNGGMRIDFPVTLQGDMGKTISTDIGGGGPTLRVRTSNGGVRVTRK